jgi:predicted O-linked N-acetylglucosamine transferase (SPINDLY family)
MPAVAPAPAIENGYVTYGSLNYFPTASKPALDLWAAVLAAKAESRLILNVPSGAARQRVEDHFAARNVSPDRLEFVFTATRNEMVRVYQRVDILLDPIPCNGLMSSCDGLWMGLPLVTLTGPAGTGGVGRSIVSNIGLPELAAESSEQYVNLAADTDRWLQQRPQLRQRMADSPLMDSRGYARDVEMAFREMYHL